MLSYLRSELKEFVDDGTLRHFHVCFSRDDPESKVRYVQDLIRNEEADLINLIFANDADNDEAIVYVCGDARNMSKDVNETIIQSTSKVLGKKTHCEPRISLSYMEHSVSRRKIFLFLSLETSWLLMPEFFIIRRVNKTIYLVCT